MKSFLCMSTGLAVAAAAAAMVAMLGALRHDRPSTPARSIAEFSLNYGLGALADHGRIEGGWRLGPDGLTLVPGGSGTVDIDIPADIASSDEPLTAVLWLYGGDLVQTRVECIASTGETHSLATGETFNGTPLALRPCQAGGAMTLRLAAAYAPGAGDEKLVVDQVQIVRGGATPAPWDARQAAGPWLLLACGALVAGIPRRRRPYVAGGVLAGSLGLAMASLYIDGRAWMLAGLEWTWPIPVAALVAAMCHTAALINSTVTIDGERPALSSGAVAIIVVGIAVAGMSVRGDLLSASLARPLDPDAETILFLHEHATHPYDTRFREPLWVWAVAGFRLVTGDPGTAIRAFSMAASFALMLVTGGAMFGLTRSVWAAGAATWLAAQHPFLIDSAVRGLRTEANALGLMLVAYLAFSSHWPGRLRTAILAVTLAAAALLQLSALAALAPMLALAVLLRRLPLKSAAVAVGVMTAAVVPHLVNSAHIFGDPLYSVNLHASFYRNYEYVVQGSGCEGCPSPEELARDSYAGARTTMGRYIFGMHDPGEVASRTVAGFTSALIGPGPLQQTLYGAGSWAVGVAFAGALVLLRFGAGWVLLLPLVGINLVAFVVPLGIDPRLLAHVVPALLLAMAAPVALLDGRGPEGLRS